MSAFPICADVEMDEDEFHKRETKYISKPDDHDELSKNFDEKLKKFKWV